MGLFSKVAKAAGRVVSGVGGERGQRVVDSARALRNKVRGEDEPEHPDEPPPWPAPVVRIWDRGHDLLSNQWVSGATALKTRWLDIGEVIEAELSPALGDGAQAIAARWVSEGEAFIAVWADAGERVAKAWEEALHAPDAVAAEGILDGSIQSGWRAIRQGWIPVRLGMREALMAGGSSRSQGDLHDALAAVEAVWSHTETQLSDRFLDGGGYLVSLVKEVADGQGHAGEILDTVQQLLAQQDSTWRESMDAFEAAWKGAAAQLSS